MAKNILAWSEAAGQFYREIGKKPNGKAIRFYLGDDEKKATANVLRLEALWDGVETRWSELASGNVADSEFPCWDDVTIALGRAIAKGEWSITLDPPKSRYRRYRRLACLPAHPLPDDPGSNPRPLEGGRRQSSPGPGRDSDG